jgi:hypothetical protein
MLRRGLAAALVLFVTGGLVLAGTYNGTVTKVEKDGDKVVKLTMIVKKDKKDKTGEEKTFKVKDLKIAKKLKKNETADASLDDLLKAIDESKNKKGVQATVDTDGEGDKEVATKVTFGAAKKKKNQ